MEHCWTNGASDARSVHGAIGKARGITLNTIQSTLKRLYAKGLLARHKVSHAHIYAPRQSREEFHRRVVGEVATRLSRHATSGMLTAFVDVAERAGEDTLERLEQLVAERLRARSKR